MQLGDFISQLFDQVEVCGCDLSVIGFNVGVFFGVLCGEFFDFIVFFILELFDDEFTVVFHLRSDFLHFKVVFLFKVCGFALVLLAQLCLSFVILCFKGECVVLLGHLLLFEHDIQRADIGL